MEQQGQSKETSSTLEPQGTVIVVVVEVVIGGVAVVERGTVGHSPTVVLVQRTMHSTIVRQWVARLVHRAPFQSPKGGIPLGNVWQQFTDKTMQYTVVRQTSPSLLGFDLVTNVLQGRVQSLKHRRFTFCLFGLFFGC